MDLRGKKMKGFGDFQSKKGADLGGRLMSLFYFIFNFLVVLEFELRTSHLLGRCCITVTLLAQLKSFDMASYIIQWFNTLLFPQNMLLCFSHSFNIVLETQ
jgi:hypothetical protein